MADVRRYRASNAQKRYKRSASSNDYALMATAASSVVIESRGNRYRTGNPEYVLFTFPHWVDFKKGFPKGYIVEKTLETNTYKVNAHKLLTWLHENGHTPYGPKELIRQTTEFERLVSKVDSMFEGV